MSLASASIRLATLSRLKRATAAALAIVACAAVSACSDGSGFRPLYATSGVGAGVSEKLATVDIAPIPGRVGQRIRNELVFQATGGGAPLPPEYRLEIVTREAIQSTLVQTDGNARAQVFTLDASFQLIRLSDKAVVFQGVSYGRAGFQRVTSIFANVRASQDAENRAAKTVGEEIKTRLTAYLSRAA